MVFRIMILKLDYLVDFGILTSNLSDLIKVCHRSPITLETIVLSNGMIFSAESKFVITACTSLIVSYTYGSSLTHKQKYATHLASDQTVNTASSREPSWTIPTSTSLLQVGYRHAFALRVYAHWGTIVKQTIPTDQRRERKGPGLLALDHGHAHHSSQLPKANRAARYACDGEARDRRAGGVEVKW